MRGKGRAGETKGGQKRGGGGRRQVECPWTQGYTLHTLRPPSSPPVPCRPLNPSNAPVPTVLVQCLQHFPPISVAAPQQTVHSLDPAAAGRALKLLFYSSFIRSPPPPAVPMPFPLQTPSSMQPWKPQGRSFTRRRYKLSKPAKILISYPPPGPYVLKLHIVPRLGLDLGLLLDLDLDLGLLPDLDLPLPLLPGPGAGNRPLPTTKQQALMTSTRSMWTFSGKV